MTASTSSIRVAIVVSSSRPLDSPQPRKSNRARARPTAGSASASSRYLSESFEADSPWQATTHGTRSAVSGVCKTSASLPSGSATEWRSALTSGARSRPGEMKHAAGVRGQAEHHFLDRLALDLRDFLGRARREPRARLDAGELAAVLPRRVAFHQQRLERNVLDERAIALTVDDFGRDRNQVSGLDDLPRDVRRGLVPVEHRALDAMTLQALEGVGGGAVRRVQRHREVVARGQGE